MLRSLIFFILWLETTVSAVTNEAILLMHKEVLCNRADKKRRKTAPWWNYTFSMHKELYAHNKIWCSYSTFLMVLENCQYLWHRIGNS